MTNLALPRLILLPGRERSLRRRHPWVFSGAVDRLDGEAAPGQTIDVAAADGTWLARAAYSPASQIMARVWTFDPDEAVDEAFFQRRIGRAVAARAALTATGPAAACRLVNAESDGLPGLIVDRYAGFVVVQFLAVGTDGWRQAITAALAEATAPAGIFERSDAEVRAKEGLPQRSGPLLGTEPPELVEIAEGPDRYWVDVRGGHKTGFYLDQRDSRETVRRLERPGDVLNGFAYTGAFTVAALRAGAASVANLDSSADALRLGRQNLELNGLAGATVEDVEGDAFQVLRRFRDARRQFDTVILDPPKFADSKVQLERAYRGYKDINLLAFKLLRPGGRLLTFSCSGLVTPELFQKIVADAALDAGRDAAIVRFLSQSADHPVALSFPEGRYLKGLLIAVR